MIIASCCDRVKQLTHFADFLSQKMCFSYICTKSTYFSFQAIERENRRIGSVNCGTANPWRFLPLLIVIYSDFWPREVVFKISYILQIKDHVLRCLVEDLHPKIHHHHEIHLLHDGSRRLGTVLHEVLAILRKVCNGS